MKVVAVVPAWNASGRLGACLGALAEQVEHTVVIDNGSTDGTADVVAARGPAVSLVANDSNRGYAAATNQGIAVASDFGADAVLLANDDAVFGPGSVASLVRALLGDPVAGAVSAHMVYDARPDVLNGAGGTFDPNRGWASLRGAGEPDRGQHSASTQVDYPSGAASLLRASALTDVGALDERYYLYFEDTDWGLRARQSGWTTIYEPRARVVHIGSESTADDPARRRYYNVRNRMLLSSDYSSRRGHARAWLSTILLCVKQPFRWPWPGRRRDAEAVCWGVVDYLRGRFGRSDRFL